ncbi:MAG TPA: HK97-gp10 family putative phage morphogenesis protein [Negativicutes bacterium]|nr:HK97-gp10 family putative phage morphogenesis protein [Negativicutes bacterium]
MTVSGLKEFEIKISKLGSEADRIAKKVVKAGANPVADEIRKNLVANLSDPAYVGKGDGDLFGMKTTVPTGDLLESFGVTPPGVDKDGNTNVHIGFEGYDRKGVPNALKARAMESGTSTLKKRPFVRPAVNSTRKKAVEEMGKALDKEIKILAL